MKYRPPLDVANAGHSEPGASERAQQAPSMLPVVLAWHVGAAAAAGGGTEHRSLCPSRYSREVLLGGVSLALACARAIGLTGGGRRPRRVL